MAREAQLTVRKILSFAPDMLDQVEQFRRQQSPIPSEAEAIRQLVQIGLETALKPTKTRRSEG